MSKPSNEEQRAFKRITHQETPYIHDVDEEGHLAHRRALSFGCPFALAAILILVGEVAYIVIGSWL